MSMCSRILQYFKSLIYNQINFYIKQLYWKFLEQKMYEVTSMQKLLKVVMLV